ncbi:MAG: NAD(+) diphosphatase [Clostridia bacterium]|nr:NAD(+) diphosphatase [Clostridia bacterium]
MIQDIAPHEYHIGYEYKREATADDFAVVVRDGKFLVDEQGHFPTFALLSLSTENANYLFCMDEQAYYMVETDVEEADGLQYVAPMFFRDVEPQHAAFAGITAVQLCNFYLRNRFCSTCGHALEKKESERALICPVCGRTVYPRISPCIIVAVTDGDRVVLTSYRNRTNYALIAGFCEVGESPEDTVRREVMEEVGLKVKNLRYYKSQPWSFSETLLMGFVAELDGDDTIHRDENELGFAAWVNRHDIADNVFHRSLTAEMILAFRDGLI